MVVTLEYLHITDITNCTGHMLRLLSANFMWFAFVKILSNNTARMVFI